MFRSCGLFFLIQSRTALLEEAIHFESHFDDLIAFFDSAHIVGPAGARLWRLRNRGVFRAWGIAWATLAWLTVRAEALSRTTAGCPCVGATRDATDGVTNGMTLGQVTELRQNDFLVGGEPEQRRQERCGTSQSHPWSPPSLRLLPGVIGDHLSDDLR